MIISTVWSNEDGALKSFKYLQKATVLSGGDRMQTHVAGVQSQNSALIIPARTACALHCFVLLLQPC